MNENSQSSKSLSNAGQGVQKKKYELELVDECFVLTLDGVAHDVVLVGGRSSDDHFKGFNFIQSLPFCTLKAPKQSKPSCKMSSENILSLSKTHAGATLLKSGTLDVGGGTVDMSVYNDVVLGSNVPFDIVSDTSFSEARATVLTTINKSPHSKHFYALMNDQSHVLSKDQKSIVNMMDSVINNIAKDTRTANAYILAVAPYRRLLPLNNLVGGTTRSSSTGRVIAICMMARALLAKNDLKVFSKRSNDLPGVVFSSDETKDYDIYYHPTSFDKEESLKANVFNILSRATKPVIVRCTLSPVFDWNDIHAKFPETIFFRSGTVMSADYCLLYTPQGSVQESPRGFFAKRIAYEYIYASYVLRVNAMRKKNQASLVDPKFMVGPYCSKGNVDIVDFSLNIDSPFKAMDINHEEGMFGSSSNGTSVSQGDKAPLGANEEKSAAEYNDDCGNESGDDIPLINHGGD